jgi:hypothetical protein
LVGVTVCYSVSTSFRVYSRAMLDAVLRKQDCMAEENFFVLEEYAYILHSPKTIDPNKYNMYIYHSNYFFIIFSPCSVVTLSLLFLTLNIFISGGVGKPKVQK